MKKIVTVNGATYTVDDATRLREESRKDLILADQIERELTKVAPKFAHLQQVRDKYSMSRRGVVIRGDVQKQYATVAHYPKTILTVVSDHNGAGCSYETEEAASKLWEEV